MSDEQSSEMIDFDFNSDVVEVGFPKVANGNYPMKVDKTYVKPAANGAINPANGEPNKNLVVEFVNTQPITAIQKDTSKPARVLEPGNLRLTIYAPMQDTGKMKPGQYQERLTEIHRACGLTGKISTGDWLNKVVTAKIVLDPERTDVATGRHFDESNSINKLLPHVG